MRRHPSSRPVSQGLLNQLSQELAPQDDGFIDYADFFALRPSWIARQTFSDVSGMSMLVTPSSDSASSTALTMVARLPAQPASPQPLVPSGFDVAGEGWLPSVIDGLSPARGNA